MVEAAMFVGKAFTVIAFIVGAVGGVFMYVLIQADKLMEGDDD